MKKRLVALLLAAMMLVSVFPMSLAAQAATATATEWTAENTSGSLSSAVLKIVKADGTIIEKSGYSIYSACSAAGDGGTVIIPKGIWYVDSIQDTYGSYRMTIQGETDSPEDTKLVARTGQGGYVNGNLVSSVGFMGTLYNDWKNKTKAYNSKAVLRIGAGDTTVRNLTLDGGTFGSTSVTYALKESSNGCDKTGAPDFDVLRCNGNSDKNKPTQILLDNIIINGLNSKTSIQIGTSSAYANVLARKSVISKNGAAFYASADTCSGSKFTALDSWIEGFVLGADDLGAGYYSITQGGVTGTISIPSAIDFYNANGNTLAGMKSVLKQSSEDGVSIAAQMTNDLCNDEIQLYSYTCEAKYQLLCDFAKALESLAGDTEVDVSEQLASLGAVIKEGNCHNFVEGSCAFCGASEPANEIEFEETVSENVEITVNEEKTEVNEETGLFELIECEDEESKPASEEEKKELNTKAIEVAEELSKNEAVKENENVNILEVVADEKQVNLQSEAKAKAVEKAAEKGKQIKVEDTVATAKLSITLESVGVKKSVSESGSSEIKSNKKVWEIKPVMIVADNENNEIYREEIKNEDLNGKAERIVLAVSPTNARVSRITHESEGRPTEVFYTDILGDAPNQYVVVELTHYSLLTQESLENTEYVSEIIGTDGKATGNKFVTVGEAVSAAAAGEKIAILKDVSEDITIPEGADIILSGKNYTLTGNITVNGTLAIYDGYFNGDLIKGENGNISLFGGTYNVKPADEFCVKGFEATKEELSELFTVHPAANVALRDTQIRANIGDVSTSNIWYTLPTLFGSATTDISYTFLPKASIKDMGSYAGWNADFEVSFDKDVAKDSLILAGSYKGVFGGLMVDYSDLGFFWPTALKAGNSFRLVKSAGKYVNYNELFTLVGGRFDCGVLNLAEENIGTTMKVKLYMYEGNGNKDAENARKILIGEYDYVIAGAGIFTGNDGTKYSCKGIVNSAAGLTDGTDFLIKDGIVAPSSVQAFTYERAYFGEYVPPAEKPVDIVEYDEEAIKELIENENIVIDGDVSEEEAVAIIEQILENGKAAESNQESNIEEAVDIAKNRDKIIEVLKEEAEDNVAKQNVEKLGKEFISKQIVIDFSASYIKTEVDATQAQIKKHTATTIVYDVTPYVKTIVTDSEGNETVVKAKIPNELIDSPIAFELDVDPSAKIGETAVVTHHNDVTGEDDPFCVTKVLGDETGRRFVALESKMFSEYGITLVNDDLVQLESQATSNLIYFHQAFLTLGNDLTLTYKAYIDPSLQISPYVEFVRHSALGEDHNTIQKVSNYKKDANGYFDFAFTGINPQCMTDSITATLYAKDANDNWYKVIYDGYSVKTYYMNMIGSVEDDLKEVLDNLMLYGEAAQKYMNYKSDNLVTDGLALSKAKDYSSEYENVNRVQTIHEVEDFSKLYIQTASVVLNNSFGLQVGFNTKGIELDRISAVATICGREYKLELNPEEKVYLGKNAYQGVTFSGINASELDDVATITFYVDGVEDCSLDYNINNYLVANHDAGGEELVDLCKALFNYGYTCDIYKGIHKD